MAKVVNSWNEWGTLKRVIVGRADGTQVPAPEPNWIYPQNNGGFPLGSWGMFPEDMTARAVEQQDNFVKILEKRDIIVDRVEVHPMHFKPTPVSTPDWTQLNVRSICCPRDVFIVMGNEILESAPSHRSRWYEYLNLRPLFQKYFKEDPEFLWGSAPKPRLTDKLYVKNYDYNFQYVWDQEERDRKIMAWEFQLTEEEPVWDGADAARAGKDIFWNISSAVVNKSGLDWVTRHYAARGIRVHPVQFDFRGLGCKPWHIDCEFTMVRPGLLITCPASDIVTPKIMDMFKRNDWEIVEAAPPSHEYHADVSFVFVATGTGGMYGKNWISMNTLALGPNAMCVEAHETAYMEQLDKMGIEVVPVPFDQVVPFGGSLHCNTLDIHREGGLEDYFPNQ